MTPAGPGVVLLDPPGLGLEIPNKVPHRSATPARAGGLFPIRVYFRGFVVRGPGKGFPGYDSAYPEGVRYASPGSAERHPGRRLGVHPMGAASSRKSLQGQQTGIGSIGKHNRFSREVSRQVEEEGATARSTPSCVRDRPDSGLPHPLPFARFPETLRVAVRKRG